MTVKTFHDIYHSAHGDGPFSDRMDKVAVAELQRYLLDKTLTNYQVSHTVERDEYGRFTLISFSSMNKERKFL